MKVVGVEIVKTAWLKICQCVDHTRTNKNTKYDQDFERAYLTTEDELCTISDGWLFYFAWILPRLRNWFYFTHKL